MLKHSDLRFDKLLFVGSILPCDFDWATLFARDQVSAVRNECGQRDRWPWWAGRLVGRAGTAGSRGFDWFATAVDNVRFEWFDHSSALIRQHIEEHWLPFLAQEPSPLAILHGRETHDGARFARMLNHTATVIDVSAFGSVPYYQQAAIPRGLSLTWIKVNPDIYTFLIDRDTGVPAGYINAMPVDDALYAQIRSGALLDNEIPAIGLMPYTGRDAVKIYLMSIAVADQYRRWGDGIMQQAAMQLLTGFLDKLIYYAKNYGVRATHILATAWTSEGLRMCDSLAMMTRVGEDKFGDAIFELDLNRLQSQPIPRLMPALRRLLEVYRSL